MGIDLSSCETSITVINSIIYYKMFTLKIKFNIQIVKGAMKLSKYLHFLTMDKKCIKL